MSETKDEIAAERDALRAENENLRGQLAAAGAQRQTAAPVQHRFTLSEGQRAELEMYGVTTSGGRRVTREQVAAMLQDDQQGVELGDGDPVPTGVPERPQTAIPGVDFVYPSVKPGYLDPAVAGRPGLSGPAAEPTATDAE
jgi:hypothetical protein